MALQTVTISSASVNDYKLHLDLVEEGTSLANNTSVISWTLRMQAESWNNFKTYHIGWLVKLAGKAISYCDLYDSPQRDLAASSEITIASGTTTIQHNSDGSLDMSAYVETYMAKASYTPGNMSLSGSMTLTSIPRGLVYIDNGSGFSTYQIFIDNGTSWDQYIPYIDNGSSWSMCSA